MVAWGNWPLRIKYTPVYESIGEKPKPFQKWNVIKKIIFEKFLTGTTVRTADILSQVFIGFNLNCFKTSSQRIEFCAYSVKYAQCPLVFLFWTIILQQCRRSERKEWQQLLILSCSPSFTLYASWMGSRARRTLAVTEPAFTRHQTDRQADGRSVSECDTFTASSAVAYSTSHQLSAKQKTKQQLII